MASVDFKEKTRERGKRNAKSHKSLKRLKVSQSHIPKKQCNQKDHPSIYNNLYNIPDFT